MVSKKGVELTMNTMIIAILVLGVLVILSFIFWKYMGGYTGGVASCASKVPGAKCYSECLENTHFIGVCDANSPEAQSVSGDKKCARNRPCFCCAPN